MLGIQDQIKQFNWGPCTGVSSPSLIEQLSQITLGYESTIEASIVLRSEAKVRLCLES